MGWWLFIAWVASFVIGALLRPKVQGPKPAEVEPPRVEDGEPIAAVFGTMKVNPSVLWYGDVKAVPVKKPRRVLSITVGQDTIAYKYLVGMQGGLCWGPIDELVDIIVDDKYSLASYGTISERLQLGPGDLGVTLTADVINPDLPATASSGGTAFTISHPGLFGGRDREGGISGTLRFYFGTTGQGANAYLQTKIGVSPLPAYKRLCYAVWEQVNWGQSQYLKPWAFVVRRCPTTLGTLAGDTALSRIGDDANPVEVLWELITNTLYGLAQPSAGYDTASFLAALQTLSDEGLGISCAITTQETEQVVDQILRDIDGVIRHDPVSGQISLKLIRGDYDRATLPVLTNSKASSTPARAQWGELTTEVKVRYTDRDAGYQTRTRQAQNLAVRQMTLRPVPSVVDHPYITTGANAEAVAMREVKALSSDLLKTTIATTRVAARLAPGDPFRHSWVKGGVTVVDDVVFRVMRITYGSPHDDEHIEIDAVEDVFDAPRGVFVTTPPDVFEPPPATGAGARFTVEPIITLDDTQGCVELSINGDVSAITAVEMQGVPGGEAAPGWTSFTLGTDLIKTCIDRDPIETGVIAWRVTYTEGDGTSATIEDEYDVPPLGADDGNAQGTPGNLVFHFIVEAGEDSPLVLGAVPATYTRIPAGRIRANLTAASTITGQVDVVVAGPSGARLDIGYSFDNGATIAGRIALGLPIDVARHAVATAAIPAEAQADVLLIPMVGDGDDASDAEIWNFLASTTTSTPPAEIPPVGTLDALFLSHLGTFTDAARTAAVELDGQEVGGWENQISGATVHGEQATSINKMTVDTSVTLNGYRSLRSERTVTAQYFSFPGLTSGYAEGTAVIVAQVDSEGTFSQGLWNLGAAATDTWWPENDGVIRDGCFTTARKTVGDPTPALTSPRRYIVVSTAGRWDAYLDGVKICPTAPNTFTTNGGGGEVGKNSADTGMFGNIWAFGVQADALDDGGVSVGEVAGGAVGALDAELAVYYGLA